ncbi:MAG: Eco29kI family restriction endonuclease [Chloroflexi bacterium]|nr:Eco29kI family restriction endonuclease [Chloroflexota bacterium]
MTVQLYDPLTFDNLMIGMVSHFEKQTMVDMDAIGDANGPGIYSLFYSGQLSIYRSISGSMNPIYVGKAVPPGSRKGISVDVNSPALRSRIRQHAKSIDEAENLDASEFKCRYLAVVPVWITLAERFLIQYYTPVWNLCIEGFGVHDPGKGRRGSQRSWWDTLHPGRELANRLAITRSADEAEKMAMEFFSSNSD